MTDKSYKNWRSMSDQALMAHMGAFVKFHRLAQNKSQESLAQEAGISRSTLSLLERGETVTLATWVQVLRVLDQLHIMDVFSVQPLISPLALAKAESAQRKKASRSHSSESEDFDW